MSTRRYVLLLVLALGVASSLLWPFSSLASSREERKRDEGWFTREIRRFTSYPHLDMAYRLIREQRYGEAISELNKYLELNPGDDKARSVLMYQYFNLARYDQAISQADIILHHHPGNTRALLLRGLARRRLGKTRDALHDFLTVTSIAKDPSIKNTARKNLLYLLEKEGKYKDILDILKELPESEKDLGIFLLEVKALAATSRKASAISRLSYLYERYSRDPEALKRIAVAADSLGETGRAIQWIKKSIALKPTMESKIFLAACLEKEGHSKKALDLLESIKVHERDEKIYIQILKKEATLAYKLGRFGLAETFYRKLLKLKRDPDFMKGLARVLEKQGKLEEAASVMARAVSLSRKPEDLIALAIIQASLGNHPESVRSVRRAIKMGLSPSQKFLAYKYLGFGYEGLGRLIDAEKAFLKALELKPASYEVNRALGELYLELDRPRHAEKYLERADRLAGDSGTKRSLANALEKQGKFTRALAILTFLDREAGGKDPEILTHIATIYSRMGRHSIAARYFLKAFDAGKRRNYRLLMFAATSLQSCGKPGKAIPLMEEYIRNMPETGLDRTYAYQRLAVMYMDNQEPDRAIFFFNKALDGHLQERMAAKVRLQLAYLFLNQGHPRKAVYEFKQVLSSREINREQRLKALMGMANAFLTFKEYGEAEKILVQAKALAQEKSLKNKILKELGIIKLKQKRYGEARNYFTRLLVEFPRNWLYRLNLGYALSGLEQYAEAVKQFFYAYGIRKNPEILIALANSYFHMNKPGVALHYLRLAQKDCHDLDEHRQYTLFEQYGYLSLREGAFGEAEKALKKALELKNTPTARLYLGIVLARTGHTKRAIDILTSGSWEALPEDKEIVRKKELARAYYHVSEWIWSYNLWKELTKIDPEAEVWFELGKVSKRLVNRDQALHAFRKAVELERNSIYLSAYGHELKDNGMLHEAIGMFRESLKKDPDQVDVYSDLAYLFMQTYQNEEAVKEFKVAIDCLPLKYFGTPGHGIEIEADKYRFKREITALTKKLSVTLWDAYVTGDTGKVKGETLGTGDRILARGTMGFEGTWILPRIGFRDYKILEAIFRSSVNLNNDSLNPDFRTTQGAVGLRYKPLKKAKFWLGMERLFSIGKDAEDNWLVRGLYSCSQGYELNKTRNNWNYSYFYSEINYYFPNRDRMLLYGEARQGWSFQILPKLVFTPHLVTDAVWYTPDRDDSSYIEGGIGISGKYFWGETPYLSDSHSAEILAYYKRGELIASGVRSRRIDGFFVTLLITY